MRHILNPNEVETTYCGAAFDPAANGYGCEKCFNTAEAVVRYESHNDI
jgi:hypothetical protein